MGYLPFLSRRFLLEQKTPQSFPTEAVFPRCHSASLFCTKSALIRIHLICAAMITVQIPVLPYDAADGKQSHPHVSMHPPLCPAPLLSQLPTLGQTLRSPFAAAVRAAVPLSATPCAGLRSRYSSPSPVYATIIHAICALVKPFLLFLYCFLAVLPIDFRHIVEGTCAERENVL